MYKIRLVHCCKFSQSFEIKNVMKIVPVNILIVKSRLVLLWLHYSFIGADQRSEAMLASQKFNLSVYSLKSCINHRKQSNPNPALAALFIYRSQSQIWGNVDWHPYLQDATNYLSLCDLRQCRPASIVARRGKPFILRSRLLQKVSTLKIKGKLFILPMHRVWKIL